MNAEIFFVALLVAWLIWSDWRRTRGERHGKPPKKYVAGLRLSKDQRDRLRRVRTYINGEEVE
jgi:hypothetical protein